MTFQQINRVIGSSVSTQSISPVSNFGSGNLIFVAVRLYTAAGIGSITVSGITDTSHLTFTALTTAVQGTLFNACFWAQTSTAGSDTITVTATAVCDSIAISVAEYSGYAGGPPTLSASAHGNGTAVSSGTVNVTQTTVTIVGVINSPPGAPPAPGSPFLSRNNQFPNICDASPSVTGTYALTGTLTASLDWVSQIFAFTSAPGGGPPPTGTTWVSNGAQTGGSGAYVAGTQSVQFLHDTFAQTGDTILIPSGTYNWTGTVTLSKGIQLLGDASGNLSVIINNQNATSNMIQATSGSDGHITINGLKIFQIANNLSTGTAFYAIQANRNTGAKTVIIRNCYMDTSAVFNWLINCQDNGIIISKCTFIGDGVNGLGGVHISALKYGATASWNTPDTMGTADTTGFSNVYMEDCNWVNAPLGGIDGADNARYVVRHSTFTDSSASNHGQETVQFGVRQTEVYNCTFKNVNGATMNDVNWIFYRGGTGVVTQNAFDVLPFNHASEVAMSVESINRVTFISCQTAWPAARQVGQGWSASSSAPFGNPVVTEDGTGAVSDPIYIWNNTGGLNGVTNVSLQPFTPDQCANGQLIQNYIIAGRDYILGTAKPGWAPFPYPHPALQSGPTTISFAGTCLGRSLSSGLLGITRTMSGSSILNARNSGTFPTTGAFAGTCTGRAANSGTISITRNLAGSCLLRAQNSGTIFSGTAYFFVGTCTLTAQNFGVISVRPIVPTAGARIVVEQLANDVVLAT